MSTPLFPLAFGSEDWRLLSGLPVGFLFGFVLERGGFGNARRLAAQFYLRDMTVFKVMFTAILTAMMGLFGLEAAGLVDRSHLWINPTFLPAQAVGGFLLGVGFILSGLCPGTAVVSMASGRLDALVALLGIVVGIAGFAVGVDLFPSLEALYQAGTGQVSLLPDALGVPPLVLGLAILGVAVLAFLGAEKVETRFQGHGSPVEGTPSPRPRAEFAVAAALGAAGVLALVAARPPSPPPPPAVEPVAPLELAEALIRREAGLWILDLRGESAETERVPGAHPVRREEAAGLLAHIPAGSTVVIYDGDAAPTEVPPDWPRLLRYRGLQGGWEGWKREVLTPMPASHFSLEEQGRIARQNQISAYFSGASPAPPAAAAAPRPAVITGGATPKKKGGGC